MHFDRCIEYVLQNEGVDSDHPADTGGRTRYGITHLVAERHGFNVVTLTLDQAKAIYRRDYWLFDSVADPRVAAKLLDVCVNFGVRAGVAMIQKAVGSPADGKWGLFTERAVRALPVEDVIERVSIVAADRYVGICIANPSQLSFLKGWIRRAIRRPKL